MKKLFVKLWNDDCGAMLTTEYALISSILISGVAAGLVAVRDATNNALFSIADTLDKAVPKNVVIPPPRVR